MSFANNTEASIKKRKSVIQIMKKNTYNLINVLSLLVMYEIFDTYNNMFPIFFSKLLTL